MNENLQKQIFEDWLNEHKGIVFKIVRTFAFNQADQEDLFQEICLNLWQSVSDWSTAILALSVVLSGTRLYEKVTYILLGLWFGYFILLSFRERSLRSEWKCVQKKIVRMRKQT